jgi:hypothetical protein
MSDHTVLKSQVEKFIFSVSSILVQPPCKVFEFVYEPISEGSLIVKGSAWIRRDSQLGSIDFIVTCVNGYKRIILNDIAAYSFNDVQWTRLFTLDEEAWMRYFSSDKKITVIFPNTRVSMKR